jgi:hypothetical protein
VAVPDGKENPATGATTLGVEDLLPPHPAARIQIDNMKIRRHLSEQDIATPILIFQGTVLLVQFTSSNTVNLFQISPSLVIIRQENEKTGCPSMN